MLLRKYFHSKQPLFFSPSDIDNNGFLDQKDFDCMGKTGWNVLFLANNEKILRL
jgi:hypothetical protein